MRPGRGISKEHLHIARPHVLAVHLIGRANIPRDPADNVEVFLTIERRRRKALTVVHAQRYFGEIAGRTCGGPRKDHVLHAAPTHRRGAVFAHYPAQSLKQV